MIQCCEDILPERHDKWHKDKGILLWGKINNIYRKKTSYQLCKINNRYRMKLKDILSKRQDKWHIYIEVNVILPKRKEKWHVIVFWHMQVYIVENFEKKKDDK